MEKSRKKQSYIVKKCDNSHSKGNSFLSGSLLIHSSFSPQQKHHAQNTKQAPLYRRKYTFNKTSHLTPKQDKSAVFSYLSTPNEKEVPRSYLK